ncbi:MAG TPA: YtxH domain-containing protein [Candidatus Binatia bacterium]|jgi:gas vesicle protein
MITDRESKFTHFIIGVGVGAVTALFIALRMSENTRRYISERASKGFESVNEQARKLRESTEKIVEKGKHLVSRRPGTGDSAGEAERQDYEESKRENLGG